MIKTIANKKLSWIHIQKPNKKDWDFIKNELSIPEKLTLEMIEQIQQPRIEKWEESLLYININIPTFNRVKQITEDGFLHIITTPKKLITITLKDNIPVKSIFHHADKSQKFRDKLMNKDIGHFLIQFLTEITTLSFDKIKHINENIDWIKDTIFEENDYNNVQEISKIKLDILTFQRVLKPQKNIFETMLHENFTLVSQGDLSSEIRELLRVNIKVWNNIESAQQIIESLEVTNNSLVSFKLNNTMRFLAAVSLITFAMSVTLGIFSIIPFAGFSLSHEPLIFWLVIFLLFIIASIAYLVFRRKKWL